MPRFAANLSMMFTEVPFLDRFARAAEAGFKAVEFLFPYEFPAADIAARLRDNGLALVLFNAPPGDWAQGERGTAALPGRQQEFRDGVARALDYAAALSCPRLHVMAGLTPEGAAYDALLATYAANLAWCAEECAGAGVKPVIEPINHRDIGEIRRARGAAGGAAPPGSGRTCDSALQTTPYRRIGVRF